MSFYSEFISGGGNPPTSIINRWSDSTGASIKTFTRGNIKAVGALSAGVLKEIFSVTGRGKVEFLGVSQETTDYSTIRLVINIDGVDVFDADCVLSEVNYGFYAVGFESYLLGADTAHAVAAGGEVYFRKNLTVSIESTVTATDSVELKIDYQEY